MSKSSRTILCIDDDPVAVDLRRRVLASKGYEVIITTEAGEALEICATKKVDLVISDHFMRGVTGGELSAKMKALHPEIPIMLLSGSPERPEGTEHADVFLTKGGAIEELLTVVAQVMSKSEGRAVSPPSVAPIEKAQEESAARPTKCPVCGIASLQMHDLQTVAEHEHSQATPATSSYRCNNGHVFMAARHGR